MNLTLLTYYIYTYYYPATLLPQQPGPTQFAGPAAITDSITVTLALESFEYLKDLKKLNTAIARIEEACRPGCSAGTLHIVTLQLQALTEIVGLVNHEENPHKRARVAAAAIDRYNFDV